MSREFTDNVIAEFRATDGHVGGDLAGSPIILIHIGARTRTERVTPLAYSSHADGRLVIAASNGGGSPTHPAWYHNLKAHPTIQVELGAETFTALAEEVTGAAPPALRLGTALLGGGASQLLVVGEHGRWIQPGSAGGPHPRLCGCAAGLAQVPARQRAMLRARP